ncbi:MAG TPA: hypothetical protein VHC22_28080 [Pirellulales bacterium]|nr:hypothetical protein [Pirellulales bacterium]
MPIPSAQPPSTPPEPTKTKGCFGIVTALAVALLVFVVLFVLTNGAIGPAAIAAAVIFGLAALHYIVWGWWLSGIIRRQVEEEERRP